MQASVHTKHRPWALPGSGTAHLAPLLQLLVQVCDMAQAPSSLRVLWIGKGPCPEVCRAALRSRHPVRHGVGPRPGTRWPWRSLASGRRPRAHMCLFARHLLPRCEEAVKSEQTVLTGQRAWGAGEVEGRTAGGPARVHGGPGRQPFSLPRWKGHHWLCWETPRGSPEMSWPRGAVPNQSHSSCEPRTRNRGRREG